MAYSADCPSKDGVIQTFDKLSATSQQLKPLSVESTYHLCVTAQDQTGNVSYASSSFAYDTTLPVTTFTGEPAALSMVNSLNMEVGGAEVVAYQYALVSGPALCSTAAYSGFQSLSDHITSAISGSGIHRICIKGKDAFGNVQLGATEYSWVRNIAPTFAFVHPTPAGGQIEIQLGTTYNLTWTATYPDSNAQIFLYQKATNSGSCASGTAIAGPLLEDTASSYGWDTSSLSSGVYYVCARIDDGINTPVEVYSEAIGIYRACTWTGTASTNFSVAGNWSGCGGGAPGTRDQVIIPSAPINQPIVGANTDIGGFGAGVGGGTVIINPGFALSLFQMGVESSVLVKGATANCSTCQFNFAKLFVTVYVRNNATLTLGHGLRVSVTAFATLSLGDGVSSGNLATESYTSDVESPHITGSSVHFGTEISGAAGNLSTVHLDGLYYDSSFINPTIAPFNFLNYYQVDKFDHVIFSTSGLGPTVILKNCTTAVINATTWNNIGYLSPSFYGGAVRASECSGLSTPITITSSGSYDSDLRFGLEYDPNNLINWSNITRFYCVWNGSLSSDWRNPSNWSSCTNGRYNYPDQLDSIRIPSGTPNQLSLNALAIVSEINSGVGGGTVVVQPGGTLYIQGNINSDVRFEGSVPTCTTCRIRATNTAVLAATLTLGKGIRLEGRVNAVFGIGNGFTAGNLITDGGSTVNEWPVFTGFKEDGTAGFVAEIVVTGTSGTKSHVSVDGLRFLNMDSTDIGLNFASNFAIDKLDNIVIDSFVDPSTKFGIFVNSCAGSQINDLTWSNIDFVKPFSGAGKNINISGCASLGSGAISVTPLTGGTNGGYGTSFQNDVDGVLSWQ